MRKSLITASLALLFSAVSFEMHATNLMDAYKDAMQNDPETLKAKAQYDIAKESEKQAFAGLLPTVSLTGSYTISNSENQTIANNLFNFDDGEVPDNLTPTTQVPIDVDSDTLQYGLSLSQAIFRMDTWYSLDASEKRALQAQAGYDLAQQALIARVTQAYFNVLKAQDNLEFVRAEKAAIERQLEQTKQRFNVGLTAITDVHEAQAQFDNSVASEIRADNDVEIAKEGLREITGKYYNDFDGLNTERFEASMPAPARIQEWVTKTENNNLELKAKELVVEATKYDIKRARAGHYPTLTLNASIGSSDSDTTIKSRHTWTMMTTLTSSVQQSTL